MGSGTKFGFIQDACGGQKNLKGHFTISKRSVQGGREATFYLINI